MKTKQVPIIITLLAGFVTCIIGFVERMEMGQFVKIWIIVLISFYILGCIAKLILDRNFREETEEATEEAAEGEETEAVEEAAESEETEKQEDSAEEEEIQ